MSEWESGNSATGQHDKCRAGLGPVPWPIIVTFDGASLFAIDAKCHEGVSRLFSPDVLAAAMEPGCPRPCLDGREWRQFGGGKGPNPAMRNEAGSGIIVSIGNRGEPPCRN